MSTCDCDRKNTNGGTCDSGCNEETYLPYNTKASSAFAPVFLADSATKVGAVESVSVEGCSSAGQSCL